MCFCYLTHCMSVTDCYHRKYQMDKKKSKSREKLNKYHREDGADLDSVVQKVRATKNGWEMPFLAKDQGKLPNVMAV